MTALLTRLLGRLPIGWLQLSHRRGRLAAALAGVAFANLLMFMQLAFLGALMESTVLPYRAMNADLIISAAHTQSLSEGKPLPRQRLIQALAVPGVVAATPLYYGKLEWDRGQGRITNLHVFGIDPDGSAFNLKSINASSNALKRINAALIDSGTRNVSKELFKHLSTKTPYHLELNHHRIEAIGSFHIGGGFTADGYLVVSDQSFLQLFPKRRAGAPSHVLLRLSPGANHKTVTNAVDRALPDSDSLVRPLAVAAAADQEYQSTQKPVGIVFGFGVIMAFLVGMIIVFQVLSTDVSDHLSEYATFKAVGYQPGFFLSVIFEEALILAVLGFIPGLLLSLGLYKIVAAATGLPVVMTQIRPFAIFIATLVMCVASGALATRRLIGADPADLF